MTFWRRLRIYLVGVGLGLLIVYVFFGDRDLSGWTPQGRILTAIDSSNVTISPRAKCQLECNQMAMDEWRMVHTAASVDFSESSTQKKPCPVYRLNSKLENGDYQLIWEVCEQEERVELLSFVKHGVDCNCS